MKARIKKGMLPTFQYKITLFNKYYDAEKRKTVWYKKVLDNCFFAVKAVENLEGNALNRVDKYIVRIPENELYTPPDKWQGRDLNFTLQVGDLVFKGEIEENIADNKDGKDLLEKYNGNSFIVQDFSINCRGIINHYHLEGV